jgi:hypothetical protein
VAFATACLNPVIPAPLVIPAKAGIFFYPPKPLTFNPVIARRRKPPWQSIFSYVYKVRIDYVSPPAKATIAETTQNS